jgi:ABC-type sugar transport system substrate-binding protein
MKKIALVFAILFTASVLVFANGGQQSGGGSSDAKVKMVLLMRNMNEQFLKDYSENMRKIASAKGVELNVQDANNSPDGQLTQLQTCINQGYKFFVILPVDPNLSETMNEMIAQVPGAAAAYSNSTPTTKSLKVGKNFFFASSPEFVGGRFQGQLIADYFDKYPDKAPGKTLNLILILGQLGHPVTINREAGLLSELKTRGYTVTIVARDTANWTPDQAQQKMDVWVGAQRGKYNVVAAQNDGMALGAVESLIQNGEIKSNASDGTILNVPVYGIDATGEALNSMKENKLYATVLQDSAGQAATAFDVIYQYATGTYKPGNSANGIPAATAVIDEEPANDPSVIGQCYLVPFAPITKDSDYYKANVK